MTIEITLLISLVGLCGSIAFGVLSARRNVKQDTQREAADMATVVWKLEHIGNGVNEIKSELRSVKADAKEDRERGILNEASTKQAHKRIDQLEKRFENLSGTQRKVPG